MDINTVLNLLTERAAQCPPGARQLWLDAAEFITGLVGKIETLAEALADAAVEDVVVGRLLDSPPTPEQMIGSLHAWIATYADGTEGIIAHGLPGLGMTPLVMSRHHVAVQMDKLARHAMELSQDSPHPVVSVRLVSYDMRAGGG